MSLSSSSSPSSTSQDTVLFTSADIERSLKRLTHELLEANQGSKNLVIIGLYTRGKYLAQRVAALIESFEGSPVPQGFLDVTLYRDDASKTFKEPQQSQIPIDITGKDVILVDDVIYSGRTIRAALDALNDYGRPASVQLLVLLDRGHRELPIAPNYVGKNVPTSKSERVNVRLQECDGLEQVTVGKS
jgi:pyrimidine operon attenuation protein / uracil phosphoribosyltransferase